jgi:anti-anti-sigma factor
VAHVSCGRDGPLVAGFILICPYLTIVTEHGRQRSVLRLRGELDTTNKHHLRSAISRALGDLRPQTLIVDLSGLDFADCGGLAVLFWAHMRLAEQGQQLVITGAQPVVRRLLSLTGLDEHLHLCAGQGDP